MRTKEINRWIDEGGSPPQDLTREEKDHLTKLGWTKMQGWHNNGQKKYENNWLHGKQHGKEDVWHDNGQKKLERHHFHGKKHGKDESWHNNGQKHHEYNWFHGKRHGKWEGWLRSGEKYYEYHYFHGMKHGVFKAWDWNEDGIIYEDEEYYYGNRIK